MSARALVRDDFEADGVKIALSPREGQVLTFEQSAKLVSRPPHIELSANEWLRLPEDVARALYEALADHFGHAGHDIRALWKDYEGERGRVDRMINFLIEADR